MIPLPVARLHLAVCAEAPLQLPPYAGSMLRGAFGHALLALSPLPHEGTKPCRLAQDCPYCRIFLSPALAQHHLQRFSHMPQPFVIEPPGGDTRLGAGDHFQFSLVLVGSALSQLRVIILAFQRAFRNGLGNEHARCRLLSVHQEGCDHALWCERDDAGVVRDIDVAHTPATSCAGSTPQAVGIILQSPLRLQRDSRPVQSVDLDARLFLVTLARRVQLLMDVHLGNSAPQQDFQSLVALAQSINVTHRELRWFDWGRFSGRQKREMKLGGLLGSFRLEGALEPFMPLLHLGQWLHVGKNTSFGLGAYRLAFPGPT